METAEDSKPRQRSPYTLGLSSPKPPPAFSATAPTHSRKRTVDCLGDHSQCPARADAAAAAGCDRRLSGPWRRAGGHAAGGSVLLVIGLTIYQEQKSERALEALRELTSPRAHVMRDGTSASCRKRAGCGDVIVLSEGDRVPADAPPARGQRPACRRIVADRRIDSAAGGTPRNVAERRQLHASTLVVRGHGIAEVVATGSRTAVGRIGVVLRTPARRSRRRCSTRSGAWSCCSRRWARWRRAGGRAVPPRCAATGWTRCWPGSPWRSRPSPKSFRSCLRCSSRWARGAWRGTRRWSGARLRSRRWAQSRCCAPTRPAR